MKTFTSPVLEAIFQRRAVKVFEPVEIPQNQRDLILDAARLAPSSFNVQPYRFYWVESPPMKKSAVRLCMGQSLAATASALVVAVADVGSWRSTIQGHLEWIRKSGLSAQKISDYELRAKFGKWFFIQGWFGIFGLVKWIALRMANLWRIIGTARVAPGTIQMGDQKHIAGLRKFDDRRRSAGAEHLSDGGLRWPQTLQVPRTQSAVS
jgi:nitroreductase